MMKAVKINDESIDISGTSYVGTLRVSYDDIVSILGEPKVSLLGSRAEWVVEFSNGAVAVICNWNNQKKYSEATKRSIEDIKEWQVGGVYSSVFNQVSEYIKNSWPVFDDIRQEAQKTLHGN